MSEGHGDDASRAVDAERRMLDDPSRAVDAERRLLDDPSLGLDAERRMLDDPSRVSSNGVIDARGLRCPAPIILLARAARDAAAETVLEVWWTDPAAETDIGAWARMRGHQLLGTEPLARPGETARGSSANAAPARAREAEHAGPAPAAPAHATPAHATRVRLTPR